MEPDTTFLVACVARKRTYAAPAKELYQSDWFRKARAYIEQWRGPWFILSAKYGLVAPEAVIEPYDETLNRMPIAERKAWARRVVGQATRQLHPGGRIVILAGQRYREFLTEPLSRMANGVEIPLAGLAIGKQLRWLREHTGDE